MGTLAGRAAWSTGGGTIIHNSSVLGAIAFPNMPLYAATKHAGIGLASPGASFVTGHTRLVDGGLTAR